MYFYLFDKAVVLNVLYVLNVTAIIKINKYLKITDLGVLHQLSNVVPDDMPYLMTTMWYFITNFVKKGVIFIENCFTLYQVRIQYCILLE